MPKTLLQTLSDVEEAAHAIKSVEKLITDLYSFLDVLQEAPNLTTAQKAVVASFSSRLEKI